MQTIVRLRYLLTAWLCTIFIWGSVLPSSVSEAASKPNFNDFKKISTVGPSIPGLSSRKAWVPQGLAVVPNKNWAVISHYSSKSVSAISITNTSSKKRIKTFYLYESDGKKHTGHVGGLAASKNYLWITSGKNVYRVALSTLSSSIDYSNIVMKKYALGHKGSYATYSNGVLWIGEYLDGEDQGTKMCQPGPKGKLRGYKLTFAEDLPSKASYTWTTPDRIQGAAMTKDRIIYSQSCGRNTLSKLLVYKQGASGKQVSAMNMPPLSEGIALNGNELYISFESGAKKYAGAYYKRIKHLYLVKTSKLKM